MRSIPGVWRQSKASERDITWVGPVGFEPTLAGS